MKIALLLALLSSPTKDYNATLIDCHNGNTCTFDIHLGLGVVLTKQTVRFCDINTPAETTKTKDNVLHLIKTARSVILRIPQKKNCTDNCDDRGKYGRWLAYIIIDGNNLNQMMLDNGLATEWKEKCL